MKKYGQAGRGEAGPPGGPRGSRPRPGRGEAEIIEFGRSLALLLLALSYSYNYFVFLPWGSTTLTMMSSCPCRPTTLLKENIQRAYKHQNKSTAIIDRYHSTRIKIKGPSEGMVFKHNPCPVAFQEATGVRCLFKEPPAPVALKRGSQNLTDSQKNLKS